MISMRIENLCRCTKNIETLFVKITNIDTPTTIGVVYRPPSGNIAQFLLEYDGILASIKDENCAILGDFNINLLVPNSEYESTMFGNNFVPVISLATHEKPGCTPSLIDNIIYHYKSKVYVSVSVCVGYCIPINF